MTKVLDWGIRVQMPNNTVWEVPVSVVAYDRAKHFAHEFGDDIEVSLREDTLPLFESDTYEIVDWAANNLNWEDVSSSASLVLTPSYELSPQDAQEGWMNGEKHIDKSLKF